MFLADRLTLDAPVRTSDGYLAVRARSARTGVYQYAGKEVDPDNAHGLRDQATVNVLRDESTVFDKAAVHSFIGKPITDDHPKKPVTSQNWRDLSRGTIMGAIRDGDHLAFDLLLTDAEAIDKVDKGKRELSNGYNSDLEFGDFTAADGTKCQARQTTIKGNHIALVDRGRAGPSCAITDAALCDAAPSTFLDSFNKEKPVKTMLIDGLTVDISNADIAEATITKLLGDRKLVTDKLTAADGKVVAHEATIVAKDAEITTLKDQVEKSKLTPQQLRDAGKAYATVAAKAKKLGVTVADNASTDIIMRAVVDAKMGDKAKAYSDEHVAIAFDSLTADLKVEDKDPLADFVRGGGANLTDGIDVEGDRTKRRQALSDAWRQPASGNA
jgi:hypothetical protein